jgi:hypothetical protein
MFTLDFARPSDFESLLCTGIGLHLWHNMIRIFPPGHSKRAANLGKVIGKMVISDWEK